jgi:hypothetical protein
MIRQGRRFRVCSFARFAREPAAAQQRTCGNDAHGAI